MHSPERYKSIVSKIVCVNENYFHLWSILVKSSLQVKDVITTLKYEFVQ